MDNSSKELEAPATAALLASWVNEGIKQSFDGGAPRKRHLWLPGDLEQSSSSGAAKEGTVVDEDDYMSAVFTAATDRPTRTKKKRRYLGKPQLAAEKDAEQERRADAERAAAAAAAASARGEYDPFLAAFHSLEPPLPSEASPDDPRLPERLSRARHLCRQFDVGCNIPPHDIWPRDEKTTTPWDALPLVERFNHVSEYLKSRHLYCPSCDSQFEDEARLLERCPHSSAASEPGGV